MPYLNGYHFNLSVVAIVIVGDIETPFTLPLLIPPVLPIIDVLSPVSPLKRVEKAQQITSK